MYFTVSSFLFCRYSTFVNWELWWPNFPILVYFKETQTKPEGQVHFFPVIFVSWQWLEIGYELMGHNCCGCPPKFRYLQFSFLLWIFLFNEICLQTCLDSCLSFWEQCLYLLFLNLLLLYLHCSLGILHFLCLISKADICSLIFWQNGKQLYDVMVERAGPSKTSGPKQSWRKEIFPEIFICCWKVSLYWLYCYFPSVLSISAS